MRRYLLLIALVALGWPLRARASTKASPLPHGQPGVIADDDDDPPPDPAPPPDPPADDSSSNSGDDASGDD